MDADLKKTLSKIANAVRSLSMEAVQKANSGHPGLPMGCAEFGAFLYGSLLRHNPKNPKWLNRDRIVLSAGHGSMWLYSLLHLSGFNLSLDDIKNFRQLHSKTPGHPEYHITDGVEATTGPLGQGVGNAVGQALGLKILAERFNRDDYPLFTSKVYCLAGDGCIMEGVSSEVSSFAGHLRLDNLVLIYDANRVTLDGFLAESFSEDVKMRYVAYGWDVFEIDAYDFDKMEEIFTHIRDHQTKPCFIMMRTIIGKGSPHKAGTSKAHGSPLGAEEIEETKKALGLPEKDFYVPQAVYQFFETKLVKCVALEQKWKEMFRKWSEEYPDLYKLFLQMAEKRLPNDLEEKLCAIEMKSPLATRVSSQVVLNTLADLMPQLIGGSADLSSSDMTMMKRFPIIEKEQYAGRNIKYGIREFGMATIATGLAETNMIVPYVGTFLTFSDYMRNAIRLAALSRIQVIYVFTHDSIFLGEDGPTHQPVEHLASLRAIPNIHLIRPADHWEVKMAWMAALRYRGPSILVLSRQALSQLDVCNVPYEEGMSKGAYIIKKEQTKPDFTLIATGSEVSLALEVAIALEKVDKEVRVISMPCWQIFELQDDEYKKKIIGGDLGVRVSIEAGVSFGWSKWIGAEGISISMESFGESAPMGDLAAEFGFTVDAILNRLLS
ncbi:Transketolase [Candidatus Rhabdochlamydia oedothoracis]|uniref:Transketolase n=1 Tax=Candidatus Rhabdochlamydia oedothoracis TaxID=2720720 RepID=A0ABX8V719_9BACT|nr:MULTISPECIES: transketolase [Rhabdochlamydia]KAG6559832.1 Transketolase [Candidatus Rhabdochlamydia sp. W815]MCL6756402.1 transketolase [Candidatus Rhabdochlamydia oedothoracis]QYF49250.1 Transketolase [Candidatus Rhabdochlamydia oedothoracis]